MIISRNIINMMIPPLGDDVNLKSKPYQISSFISELIYFLGINPKLKFNRIISTPEVPLENLKYTNNSWLSLTKRGAQMMKNYSNESKVDWSNNQTVSNNSVISIYRGKSLSSIPEEDNLIVKNCKDNGTKLKEYKDINSINSYEKHLTLLTNSNYYCQAIKKTLQKAYEMYEYNAFIHQYEKYNLQKDDFIEAFSFCEQIIYDYTHI